VSSHTARTSARRLAALSSTIAVVLALTGVAAIPASAASCATSGPAGYQVTVCFTSPSDGATLSGSSTVTATATVAGTNPGVRRMVYYLNGAYALTDYQAPYTFSLPTQKFADGAKSLQVEALMRDNFTSSRASTNVTFSNGNSVPPVNGGTFTPSVGRTPGPGEPFVLAATGDGASGEANAGAVSDLVASWNPNMFLYLGDVYEKGSISEFANWYGGSSSYFGRLRAFTNPTVGNHEYEGGVAPGYFDYWDNVPHYYSFTTAGWHMISLDSTSQFNQFSPSSAQYQWLQADLSANTAGCTLAFFHHPVRSVGPQGDATTMNAIWSLLAAHGVDVVLTGHDHSYQRWVPLNGSGQPSPTGITQFVVGTGGHAIQSFVRTDTRLAAGFDAPPDAYGAFRMSLNPGGASYRFENASNVILDSGSIACGSEPDTQPPTAPSALQATAVSHDRVDLTWTGATDNVAVDGYQIIRNGVVIDTVGVQTVYTDSTVSPSTPYTYTVRALDAAGLVSPPSNDATVTTPAFSPIVFADDFESGGLSNWTTVAGMVVQQQAVHAGAYAARASSTGAAAQSLVQLDQTASDLFYRTWFKVESQGSGSSVYLLKFRTATGASLVGVYVNSNGTLRYRNDVAGTTSSSSVVVTPGVWHELQVRLRTGAGRVETWLDGASIAALTKNEAVGSVPIGRLQLGDNSTGRTFSVAFDDVVASTQQIT
jgi:hypothetical protein